MTISAITTPRRRNDRAEFSGSPSRVEPDQQNRHDQLRPNDRRSYFFRVAFEKGDGALPALIAAQRRFAASAIALRPAALSLRLGEAAFAACCAFSDVDRGDPGGRTRLFVGACKASIALDRRSRSAISKTTICSVCMTGE